MSEDYNIFISWSGTRSKWVAEALREWLPVILQTAKPWMSDTDIEKGSRGLHEISSRLQGTKVGIVCLTPENLNAPWILYEAGALSKTIDDKTRLCTYLLGDLRFQDVEGPLGMFQSTNPDKKETQKLVHTINKAVSDKPVQDSHLDLLFERLWPDLEAKLTTLPASRVAANKRSVDDMVTEILELARGEINYREAIQTQISQIQNALTLTSVGVRTGFGTLGQLNQTLGTTRSPAIPLDLSNAFDGFDVEPSKEEKATVLKRAVQRARESKDKK